MKRLPLLFALGCAANAAPSTADQPFVPPPWIHRAWQVQPLEPATPNPTAKRGAANDTPWESPPHGVACVVGGDANPFPPPCSGGVYEVHTQEGLPLASFEASGIHVVWGLPKQGKHAWLHARGDAVSLTGFTDMSPLRFRLLEQKTLVKGHVWVKADAPLKILRADVSGVTTLVDEPVGLQNVPLVVPCEALAYSLPTTTVPGGPTSLDQETPETFFPSGRTLSLHTGPTAPVFTRLASNDEQLPLELTVIERRSPVVRVKFETEHVRYDVWVAESEVTDERWGTTQAYGDGCASFGGIGVGTSAYKITTNIPTNALVGLGPEHNASHGLTLASNLIVWPGERVGDYVSVEFESPFDLVAGHQVWVPSTSLSQPE